MKKIGKPKKNSIFFKISKICSDTARLGSLFKDNFNAELFKENIAELRGCPSIILCYFKDLEPMKGLLSL